MGLWRHAAARRVSRRGYSTERGRLAGGRHGDTVIGQRDEQERPLRGDGAVSTYWGMQLLGCGGRMQGRKGAGNPSATGGGAPGVSRIECGSARIERGL